MSTTVYLPYRTTDQAIDRITHALDEELARNPNWNGATFDIEFDDYCWIETENEIDGTQLLHRAIYPALDKETDHDS